MSADTWMWLLAALLVAIGVAGSVLPALPGVPLVFAGLVVAAWADDFQKVGWFVLSLLALLTVLSFLIDLAATALGAKRVGATRLAVIGAALGTVLGIFLGLPGLLLGPFAGADHFLKNPGCLLLFQGRKAVKHFLGPLGHGPLDAAHDLIGLMQ